MAGAAASAAGAAASTVAAAADPEFTVTPALSTAEYSFSPPAPADSAAAAGAFWAVESPSSAPPQAVRRAPQARTAAAAVARVRVMTGAPSIEPTCPPGRPLGARRDCVARSGRDVRIRPITIRPPAPPGGGAGAGCNAGRVSSPDPATGPDAVPPPHVVVVGGGVAGLAAAWFLSQRDGLRVTVLEASPRIGGKLGLADVAGLTVDTGAESLLARRPEAVDLVTALGLADDIVHPVTTSAGVWTRGRVHPLPTGQVMGVPTDLGALTRSGVLSRAGVARAALERVVPARRRPGDVSLGRFVAARLGREVVDRLVDPLVGGVYAGHADRLSLAATVPVLAPALREGVSLTAVARRALDRTPDDVAPRPVFAGLRGGVGRLPGVLALRSGADVRTGVTVTGLRRAPDGWRLDSSDGELAADGVVVAVPGGPAARLLAGVAPVASAELGRIPYASVAVVTLVLPAPDRLPPGSGFLVPGVDGRFVKAATYSSGKWAWVARAAPGRLVVRASVGRHGEQTDLQHDDAELVRRVRADLAAAAGLSAEPVGSLVTRWGGALPQYEVGHLDRVARVRAGVGASAGLAVCGAAYDGVGIAACVASARLAAEAVLAALPGRGTMTP